MVKNPGFTLIEVLVVAIIIGILSAIALPSFLNQANKARQSEGKMLVSSHNRAQSAYRLSFLYSKLSTCIFIFNNSFLILLLDRSQMYF